MTFYICISYTVLKFTILSFLFSPLGFPLLWIYIHEFTYYYIHTYFIWFMKKIKEYLSVLMFWKASLTLELKSSESSRIPHSDLYILVGKSNIESDLKKKTLILQRLLDLRNMEIYETIWFYSVVSYFSFSFFNIWFKLGTSERDKNLKANKTKKKASNNTSLSHSLKYNSWAWEIPRTK